MRLLFAGDAFGADQDETPEGVDVKRRKLRRQVRKLERRVAELEGRVQLVDSAPVQIDQPEFDVHALWRDCVADWQYGWDDDEDWSNRGYL